MEIEGFTSSFDPLTNIRKQKEDLKKQLAVGQPPEDGEGENTDDKNAAPVNGDEGGEDGKAKTEQTPGDGEPVNKDDDSETWKSKFLVLQGKYDAEVPRLSLEIRQLKSEIESLTTKLQDAEKSAAAAPVNTIGDDDLMEELEERFGPELVEAFMKIASKAASGAKDQRQEDRIAQMEKELNDVKKETAEEKAQRKFYAELSNDCPDWSDIDKDKGFNIYIRETVIPTGETLKQLIDKACEAGDAATVARIFNSYQPPKQPGQETDQAAERKKQELEMMATPTRKGGGVNNRIEDNKGDVMYMRDFEQLQRDYVGRYDHPDYIKRKAEFRKAAAAGKLLA